jgi:hypothetical protein
LLVGKKLVNAVEAYERGFILRGADDNGECLANIDDFSNFGDTVVNFGEDIVYGCTKRLTSIDL